MKDMQAQLEKLRTQAAECEMVRNLATERSKRALFSPSTSRFWRQTSNERWLPPAQATPSWVDCADWASREAGAAAPPAFTIG